MIIWINGAFGSGKTSAAFELNNMIENSYVYDPEEVGQCLRKNMPESHQFADFQDHPLWRTLNYEALKYLHQEYDGTVIVPMTLVNEEYYNSIVMQLRENDVEIRMFTLLASKEILIKRLGQRGDDGNSWPAQQIDRCVSALNQAIFKEHIHTDDMSVREVAEYIIKQCIPVRFRLMRDSHPKHMPQLTESAACLLKIRAI